ncbi:RHS repeat-associated core domain-containing protein [Paraburkholderia agricolaris]|uniref:RHS repeat-associated core domain-containing protein n=1 Tax=Paraburkholderia agricolaris TaxID=2152888 RepID=UPI0012911D06
MRVGTFVYYRNRYYSPQTGRFISEDPIGYASGQTNAYAYVGGNSVQFSDPSGLQFAGGGSLTPGPYVPGGGFGPRTPGSGSQGLDDWLSNPSGGTFADSNADDPVVYPNNPDESAERFKNIPGTPGKQCLDGSVWERDKSGHGNREGDGSQWKRWPNRKSWENGRTPQSIWPDGRIRK